MGRKLKNPTSGNAPAAIAIKLQIFLMMTLPITHLLDILSLIPQRDPMLMVDSLWEYTSSTAVAGLTISSKNLFVQENYLQEAGLIEHLAQSIALHKGYCYYLNGQPAPMGYIGAIKKINIEALPAVGQSLRTHLTIVHEFMGVTLVRLQSFVEEKLMAEGEMKTVLASLAEQP